MYMGYWILSPSTIGLWPLPPATNTLTPDTPNLTFCLYWHHPVKSPLTEFVFCVTWQKFVELELITWRDDVSLNFISTRCVFKHHLLLCQQFPQRFMVSTKTTC
ncbi:hypothetical protein Hanom_Chr09g00865371 [Helianthus anomalus]